MKRSLLFVLALAIAAAALAAGRPLYRIVLRNGGQLLTVDQPVARGSVLVFHAYPAGTLTGVPREEVAGLASADLKVSVDEISVTSRRPLEPGEVVFLGPTAPNPPEAPVTVKAPAATPAPYLPGGVYDPRNPWLSGYAPPRNATIAPGNLPTGVLTGDTARALSGPPPTMEAPFGSNGFPNTGAATPAIGPDGMPILIPRGAPGSTPPPIGPNGYPVIPPR